ncbi:putative protease [Caudoviricetes sp.]|jgi:hypothetical protein|nr:putative protease [Caudoviricetes sp.]
MTEMQMTDQAATTNEGQAASQEAVANALYNAGDTANQQQANTDQNQTKAEDGDGAGNSEGEGKEAPQGAPEKYEFKAPEGQEFDTGTIEAFSEIAKELNLTQEAAQKLLDRMGPTIETQQKGQLQAIHNEWKQASQTDKEFGGEKLAENLSVAKKALDAFGSPELRVLLEQSGLGNNPEVIRFMFRAGKAISEDSFVGRSTGAGKPMPKDFGGFASALYTNQQN